MGYSSFPRDFPSERVGALSVMGSSAETAQKALSHMKTTIRQMYSNPPSHGGQIITTIMNDAQLRAEWELEVKEIRDRSETVRHLEGKGLKVIGALYDIESGVVKFL